MYITINTGNINTIISGFSDFDISSEIFSEEFTNSPAYSIQLQQIFRVIKEKIKDENIQGVGIAHTGELDLQNEIIVDASHAPDYNDHSVIKDIKNACGLENVYMINDSLAASLAEAIFGKAKEYNTIGVVYLSWGIGGAYLKRIDKNSFSIFSAEIGHQIVEPNGKICSCGQRGCLEAYVSAESIKKRFLVDQTNLNDMNIWDELTDYMAIGASNLYNIFFPEILILSGKTLSEIAYVRQHLIQKIVDRSEIIGQKQTVEISDFNEKGPTLGALALLKIKDGGNTITHIE